MNFSGTPGDDPLLDERALDDEPARPEGALLPLDEGPEYETDEDALDDEVSLPETSEMSAPDEDDEPALIEALEFDELPPLDDALEDSFSEEPQALDLLPELDEPTGDEDSAMLPFGPFQIDEWDDGDEDEDLPGSPPPGEPLH